LWRKSGGRTIELSFESLVSEIRILPNIHSVRPFNIDRTAHVIEPEWIAPAFEIEIADSVHIALGFKRKNDTFDGRLASRKAETDALRIDANDETNFAAEFDEDIKAIDNFGEESFVLASAWTKECDVEPALCDRGSLRQL
jgi:hypothetical protein